MKLTDVHIMCLYVHYMMSVYLSYHDHIEKELHELDNKVLC